MSPPCDRRPTVDAVTDNLRRLNPPRAVEVLHDGQWLAGAHGCVGTTASGGSGQLLGVQYEWGPGKHLRSVPA